MGCPRVAVVPGTWVTFAQNGWTVETAVADQKAQLTHYRDVNGASVCDAIVTVSTTSGDLLNIVEQSPVAPTISASGAFGSIYLYREYTGLVDGDNERRIGPQRGQWVAVTWAAAGAANQILRFEARIDPASSELSAVHAMLSSIGSISQHYSDATPPVDAALAAKLSAFKQHAAIVLPWKP